MTERLPVGMQWIGRRYADADVLPASAAIERIRPGSTPISCVPTGHIMATHPSSRARLKSNPDQLLGERITVPKKNR